MFRISTQHGMTDFSADDLPQLTGSQKQISWATDLRNVRGRYLANSFDQMFRNARDRGEVTDEQRLNLLAAWSAKHLTEMSNVSARYWIDHR